MTEKPTNTSVAVTTRSTMIPTDTSTKLTKRIFLTAPTGGLLVSNCMHSPTLSIFEERIEPAGPARARQWQRIVLAGASQRLCRVFRSRADYQKWLSTLVCPQHF